MDEIIEKEGYKFIIIKSINPDRPYRIRCLNPIDSEDTKDSSISYDNAIDLYLDIIKFKKSIQMNIIQDEKRVKKIFLDALLYKNISDINDIVKNTIAGTQLKDTIYYEKREKTEHIQRYRTSYFEIEVICNQYIPRKVKEIKVKKIR